MEEILASYPPTEQSRNHKAAVCVRPIFGPYDNLNQVVLAIIVLIMRMMFDNNHKSQIAQFLAFYSTILGVSTFR